MKKYWIILAATATLAAENVSTFSIVAFDSKTGDIGITVASRYFSVGSVVPWAEAGVGAVATQANVNVGYGPRGIELLKQGLTAQQVIDKLLAEDTFDGKDGRQVAVADAKGNVATYTGPNAPNWAGSKKGANWAAQGNILVGPQVPDAMGKAFESTQGELAEKLYAALKAGDAAGGDSRGRQSASMLIVRKGGGRNTNNDRYLYINVDDNPDPFTELRRLLDQALGYNYQDKTFKLLGANKITEAQESAAQVTRYWPKQPGAHSTLGMLYYVAGDKAAAAKELKQAYALDPNIKKQFEAGARIRPAFQKMLEDREFLAGVFGPQ